MCASCDLLCIVSSCQFVANLFREMLTVEKYIFRKILFALSFFVFLPVSCEKTRDEHDEERQALKILTKIRDRSFSWTGASLDRYYESIDHYFDCQEPRFDTFRTLMDSLSAETTFFDLVKIPDKELITDEYLSHRVESAFSVRKYNWAKHLSFRDFCEYILPYRIGNELPEEWWVDYKKHFGPTLDSLSKAESVSITQLVKEINSHLPSPSNYTNYPLGKPDFRASYLKKMIGGSCYDYASLLTFVGRTYGIPMATDFTPQWGNHSYGHAWGAVILGDSTYYYLTDEPLCPAREKGFDWRLVKVYRKMTLPQGEAPGRKSHAEELPPYLRDPRILDVTRLYRDVIDLPIENLWKSGRQRFVTLNVFDGRNWTPIAGARRRGNLVTFHDVGLDCVFLPMYHSGGSPVPAGWPVLLSKDRSMRELHPLTNQLQEVRLTRMNNSNFVQDEYELFFWDGSSWSSLGKEVCDQTTYELHYKNVPQNALLLLHSRRSGMNERIFTYENGKQVWW